MIFSLTLGIAPNFGLADEIDEINEDIAAKKQELQQIQDRIAEYQVAIDSKRNEVASLQKDLDILENEIAKAELAIKATKVEITENQLETRNLEIAILHREDEIEKQKGNMKDLILEMYKKDSANELQILLMNDSISEYFNELEYTKKLENSVFNTLKNIQDKKNELEESKSELEDKRDQLLALQKDLEIKEQELKGEVDYKNILITETQNSEAKYTELYWKAQQEQQSANNEIIALEREARRRLEQAKGDRPELTDAALSWPVPKNTITATFHDPTYPFRHLFEHPGIDVRAGQGTQIKAPADGYIIKAKNNGMGYSYLSILHANGISTVYGHVSKFYVSNDEYVKRGEVVALTGGMPGTPGAGNLSTGPHLHFEVRLNGIPVNPLDYLP